LTNEPKKPFGITRELPDIVTQISNMKLSVAEITELPKADIEQPGGPLGVEATLTADSPDSV